MAIAYHGALEGLAREVAEAKPLLDEQYHQILGPKRAQILSRAAERMLSPACFFDSAEAWNAAFRDELPPDAPNRMSLVTAADWSPNKVDLTGRLADRWIKTSVALYVSDPALAGSQAPDQAGAAGSGLAVYVHTYNSFVWYALQRVPLQLLTHILDTKVRFKSPDDLDRIVEQLRRAGATSTEQLHILTLGLYAYGAGTSHAQATQILDKAVLAPLGISTDLPWRGVSKRWEVVSVPYGKLVRDIIIPIGGDWFADLTDGQAVEAVLNWPAQPRFRPRYRTPYLDNLVDSLQRVKVSRVPIQELKQHQEKERKRR